jgi:arylsulfatase A-like enzyme
MNARPPSTLTALAFTVALAAACGDGGGEREPTGVNVVLISLDSTRRDLVGAYGRTPKHAPELSPSPNIDALAARGVLFEDAYASTSWTLPSHVSLLTGQPEVVHAVDMDTQRVDPRIPLLPEVLRRAGYATYGVYSAPYLEPVFGFERGFDRYEASYGAEFGAVMAELRALRVELQQAVAALDRARTNELAAREAELNQRTEDLSHADVSSQAVADGALRALGEAARDGRPFFLFAHFFDPHYDYVPPAPWDARFDPGYGGGIDGRDFYTSPAISTPIADAQSYGLRQRVVSERDLEHVQALYEGELAWTDAQVGRVLDELERLGLRERTLVVVTADHGDEFFEHGSIGHRRTLHEEVVRTPLVMSLPGTLPAGRRLAGPVSNVDVAATVLELCGVAEPADMASRSLVPFATGRADGPPGGVLGRLVHVTPIDFDVPIDGEARKLPGRVVRVFETWHAGTLKVQRSRLWTRQEFETGVWPAIDAQMEAQTREMFAEEDVAWIDLALHPDEAQAAWSRDFTAPPARAALRAFHDRYADLLELRRASLTVEDPAALGALRGLGYAGDDAPAEAYTAGEFRLPPPGRQLLR